jgi:hypothetical protein
MSEMLIRVFKVAIVASIAFVIAGAVACAGEYHVYSCRMPSGASAPVDGWGGSVAEESAIDTYVIDTCPQGGALVAALGDQTGHAANIDLATWAFHAPDGDRIAGATLWRTGSTQGGEVLDASYQFWLAGPTAPEIFDECVFTQRCPTKGDPANPMSGVNRVALPDVNLGSAIYASVSCGGGAGRECPAGAGDSNGYAAAVYLDASDVTLEQPAGPHASAVTGELASASTIRGQSDIAFDAIDPGAGMYEAQFSVDGRVVQKTVLDDNGGRCRDVGETTDGLPAFLYVQPCLPSVSADVGFDTTRVANGVHHVIVSALDAAGNAAPVLDRTLTVDNPPQPGIPGPANGTNASTQATLSVRWQGTKKVALTSGYRKTQVVTGRLTAPGGAPISGATIDVRASPSYAGATTVTMASPRTDANGRFSIRVASGTSSCVLRLAYRAHLGDALPVATRTLRLNVRAGVSLRVAPHTANAGSEIHFGGRLRGGPIPRGGKQLVLEARSPGSSWIEFKVVRTDRHGHFHASYRFKFAGPADYRFRVRSEAESDFPFAAGSSNVVGVHER